MMINKVFVASSNKSKIKEFKEIFDILNIKVEIVSPIDFNDTDEVEENGKSYEENSYIKAFYYYQKYHLPTLADDSGIEIDFYNGMPGIYSARFLSDMTYSERNAYIINQMNNSNNRNAKFTCCITYINNDVVKTYIGVVNGQIALEIKGNEGFGYDPIFIPEGYNQTNAELGSDFKNTKGHRAIALRKWANDFEK